MHCRARMGFYKGWVKKKPDFCKKSRAIDVSLYERMFGANDAIATAVALYNLVRHRLDGVLVRERTIDGEH